jgi:hypothetical protein
LNVELPQRTPEGCAVPLVLRGIDIMSQDVAISVRRGGGACVDPPAVPSSSALLEWRWTQSSGVQPSGVFSANFTLVRDTRFVPIPTRQESIENGYFLADPLLPDPWTSCKCYEEAVRPKSCPQFADKQLDAGVLNLGVPDHSIAVRPSLADGNLTYQAVLPSNAMREGAFTVSGPGGVGVGPFQTSTAISPPINLLSSFAPGSVLSFSKPLDVHWTGGRAGDVVRLRFTRTVPDYSPQFCECSVPATAGAVVIPLVQFSRQYPPTLPLGVDGGEYELTVTQEAATETNFGASGLSAGGKHRWLYEWRFGGLKYRVPLPPQ